jgi:hypothetical protein
MQKNWYLYPAANRRLTIGFEMGSILENPESDVEFSEAGYRRHIELCSLARSKTALLIFVLRLLSR